MGKMQLQIMGLMLIYSCEMSPSLLYRKMDDYLRSIMHAQPRNFEIVYQQSQSPTASEIVHHQDPNITVNQTAHLARASRPRNPECTAAHDSVEKFHKFFFDQMMKAAGKPTACMIDMMQQDLFDPNFTISHIPLSYTIIDFGSIDLIQQLLKKTQLDFDAGADIGCNLITRILEHKSVPDTIKKQAYQKVLDAIQHNRLNPDIMVTLSKETPLMLEVGKGNVQTVRMLLSRGSNPNLAINPYDAPLKIARRCMKNLIDLDRFDQQTIAKIKRYEEIMGMLGTDKIWTKLRSNDALTADDKDVILQRIEQMQCARNCRRIRSAAHQDPTFLLCEKCALQATLDKRIVRKEPGIVTSAPRLTEW